MLPDLSSEKEVMFQINYFISSDVESKPLVYQNYCLPTEYLHHYMLIIHDLDYMDRTGVNNKLQRIG